MPLNCTDTPASETGSGIELACIVTTAKLEPKMDTSEPGETGVLKLAPFTTGLVPSTGCENARADKQRRTTA